MAAGGGLLTVTTVYKVLSSRRCISTKFVEGVLFSLDYVGSFLAIPSPLARHQATRDDGAGAGAEATAKRNRKDAWPSSTKTIALIRSQMAANSGNLAIVFPVALGVQLLAHYVFGGNLLSREKAEATIHSSRCSARRRSTLHHGVLL